MDLSYFCDVTSYFEEIFGEIRQLFNEWTSTTNILDELRDMVFYTDDKSLTPRAYGQSLHKRVHTCPKYAYVRGFQRHMPYHRRQH